MRVRLDGLGDDSVLAQVGTSSLHRRAISSLVPIHCVSSGTVLDALCKTFKYEDIALPNILPLNNLEQF